MINDYPEDLQGLITDYLVGEKQDFIKIYSNLLRDLKMLISDIDIKKANIFYENGFNIIKSLPRDKIFMKAVRNHAIATHEYRFNHCCVPTSVHVIFTRIRFNSPIPFENSSRILKKFTRSKFHSSRFKYWAL